MGLKYAWPCSSVDKRCSEGIGLNLRASRHVTDEEWSPHILLYPSPGHEEDCCRNGCEWGCGSLTENSRTFVGAVCPVCASSAPKVVCLNAYIVAFVACCTALFEGEYEGASSSRSYRYDYYDYHHKYQIMTTSRNHPFELAPPRDNPSASITITSQARIPAPTKYDKESECWTKNS